VASAILPYLVARSAVAPLMRRIYKNHPQPATPSAAKPGEKSGDLPASPPTTDH